VKRPTGTYHTDTVVYVCRYHKEGVRPQKVDLRHPKTEGLHPDHKHEEGKKQPVEGVTRRVAHTTHDETCLKGKDSYH